MGEAEPQNSLSAPAVFEAELAYEIQVNILLGLYRRGLLTEERFAVALSQIADEGDSLVGRLEVGLSAGCLTAFK